VSRTAPPAPVTAVPRRMRLLLALIALVVFGVLLAVALSLRSNSTGVIEFGVVDQVAIAGLGAVLAGGVLFLGRSRVDADAEGIRVLNVFVRHQFTWQAVRAVRFDPKSAWASLLLENDDEVSLLAVQAGDKERAVHAVEGLRALHAAARANDPVPPPLLYDD
jgi:hypothetical protein